MRLPHTINPLTKEAYSASAVAVQLLDESGRAIRPSNILWEDGEVESLVTLCVRTIASHFEKNPLLEELPLQDREHLVEILPTDLPLELMISLIKDEIYWQRRYNDIYGFVVEHKKPDSTWKSIYIERYVRQLCEEAEPQYGDSYTFEDELELCAPFVRMLIIKQLTHWTPPKTASKEEIPRKHPVYHINFLSILSRLPNITTLEIMYGMRDVGMDYTAHMFIVDVDDLAKLATAVNTLPNLKSLKIHRSNISCEHIRRFVKVLILNEVIVELNLSYCKIGNEGAKCLAKLMTEMHQLRTLNLRCNNIGPEGASGLAYALAGPDICYIQRLDIGLNPLGNEGIMPICSALLRSSVPLELIIRGCGVHGSTAITVASMLQYNYSLRELDIAVNDFGAEAGKVFVSTLEGNKNMIKMDLRETGIPEELQVQIKAILARNNRLFVKERERKLRMSARRSITPSAKSSSMQMSQFYDDMYQSVTNYSNWTLA